MGFAAPFAERRAILCAFCQGLPSGVQKGVSIEGILTAPVYGDGALFSAAAISAPKNTPKAEASFTDELAKTLKSGFTAEEVATAKKAYHDQQIVARSQEQLLVRTIASRDQAGRTMKWDEDL